MLVNGLLSTPEPALCFLITATYQVWQPHRAAAKGQVIFARGSPHYLGTIGHPLPKRAAVLCHLLTTARACADHSPSSQALERVPKPQQLVLFTKKKKSHYLCVPWGKQKPPFFWFWKPLLVKTLDWNKKKFLRQAVQPESSWLGYRGKKS